MFHDAFVQLNRKLSSIQSDLNYERDATVNQHRNTRAWLLKGCKMRGNSMNKYCTLSILAWFSLIMEAWANLSNTVLMAFLEYNSCGLNNSSIKRLLNMVPVMSCNTGKKKRENINIHRKTLTATFPTKHITFWSSVWDKKIRMGSPSYPVRMVTAKRIRLQLLWYRIKMAIWLSLP